MADREETMGSGSAARIAEELEQAAENAGASAGDKMETRTEQQTPVAAVSEKTAPDAPAEGHGRSRAKKSRRKKGMQQEKQAAAEHAEGQTSAGAASQADAAVASESGVSTVPGAPVGAGTAHAEGASAGAGTTPVAGAAAGAGTAPVAGGPAGTGTAAERGDGTASSQENTGVNSRTDRAEEPNGTEAPHQAEESHRTTGRSRKRKKAGKMAFGVAAAIVLAAGGAYVGLAQQYHTHFLPNTQINGLDASGKTAEDVKQMIAAGLEHYELTLEGRGDVTETIGGDDIGVHPEFDGTLEHILAGQNPYIWPSCYMSPVTYTVDTMVSFDQEKLEASVDALACMQPGAGKEPGNATVSDYIPGQGYTVAPGEEGTVILRDAMLTAVSEAVSTMQNTLSLDEAGVYKQPRITVEDPGLIAQAEALNRYAAMTITYRFGEETEILNGDRIHEWIVRDETGNLDIDDAQVAAYVEELANKWNTYGQSRKIQSSMGTEVEVLGGTYGWRIDQEKEAEELAAVIRAGQDTDREPVYAQTAASWGDTDFGTTYVEVNLTDQHLWYYKDGSLVTESDFVSGNMARGMGTPGGAYALVNKQRNAVLRGQGYASPVSYWMPFNRGIGLHDASWRGSFGGSIYRTNGSHGCVNLPKSAAKTIFENIETGTPILCYYVDEKENKSVSYPKSSKPAAAAAPTAPAQPVVPAETQPAAVEPTVPAEQTPSGPAGPASDIVETPAPAAAEQAAPVIVPEAAPAAEAAVQPAAPAAPEAAAPAPAAEAPAAAAEPVIVPAQ